MVNTCRTQLEQEKLDQQLQQRQARETGICPIREELYAQCFGMSLARFSFQSSLITVVSLDELIRQITINCAERGLLLLRVRDEIRMTIAAYQTLYESSVAFGMRKALMAEQRKLAMQAKIRSLKSEIADLEKQVDTLKEKCLEVEKREQDKREKEEKEHQEEVRGDEALYFLLASYGSCHQVEKLRTLNSQLKSNLESMLAVPGKK